MLNLKFLSVNYWFKRVKIPRVATYPVTHYRFTIMATKIFFATRASIDSFSSS